MATTDHHRITVVLHLTPGDPPVYISDFHTKRLLKELFPHALGRHLVYSPENPVVVQVLLDFGYMPIRSELNRLLRKLVKRLQAQGLPVIERRDYLKVPQRPGKQLVLYRPPARRRIRQALLRLGGGIVLLIIGFPALAG
ncbi:MAG TPA: hypothetical protein VHP58_00340 [Alphaproteobacteria bacterium]|nr:hypothetical protein [Alphaproteobacteria bacterium]